MSPDLSNQSTAVVLLQLIWRFLTRLGPLRVGLLLITLMTIVLAPGMDTPTGYQGYAFFRTVILPTFMPLCLSGLLLDALMSRVVMGDADEAGRSRLRLIIRTELAAAALLVVSWLPFFLSIGQ